MVKAIEYLEKLQEEGYSKHNLKSERWTELLKKPNAQFIEKLVSKQKGLLDDKQISQMKEQMIQHYDELAKIKLPTKYETHLNHRDVTMIAVSHAPYSKIDSYKKRMGWDFKWVSSSDNDFNFDYHVSFKPKEVAKKKAFYNFTTQDPLASEREGVSVFYKDRVGKIFHTYSTYARGIDLVNTAYNYLDLTPKGRDEGNRGQFWVRRHDEYE